MKVGLVSLGCARTLVDSEVALGSLKKEGYRIVRDVRNADVAVVNTCGFIEEAKIESIETILKLCQMKKNGRLSAVVVLGCLAQRHGAELKKEIPEADAIIGTDSYEDLPRLLAPILEKEKTRVYEVKDKPRYILNESSPRVSLTPEHYAYVKISEGCINACSYCMIPKMKGPHRSRPIASILSEIERLAGERKLSEINLIGQDTAAYGIDQEKRFMLPELLRAIGERNLVPWARLLYAHPGHVTPELIEAMASTPTICKYVDFPVEHANDAMLVRMNRGVTRAKMDWALAELRRRIPGVSVRTTIIVGFPGETEEEFKDLMGYLAEARFERLGAFMYSDEEGSKSHGMGGKIPDAVKKERFNAVMAQQREISMEQNDALVGSLQRVLIDEAGKEAGVWYGRREADAPDVDGQVIVKSPKPLEPGQFLDVRVTDALEYDLIAVPA